MVSKPKTPEQIKKQGSQKKILFSLTHDHCAEVDKVAASLHMNRTMFIKNALMHYIDHLQIKSATIRKLMNEAAAKPEPNQSAAPEPAEQTQPDIEEYEADIEVNTTEPDYEY